MNTANAISLAETNARHRLKGRVLTIINWESAEGMALHLNVEHEGLVITGARRHQTMRKIRRMVPELLLLAEPDAHDVLEASAETFWHISGSDEEGLFDSPTLADTLAVQRENGAGVVLLPAGFIEVGDVDTLRNIVFAANELADDDIALPIYLATGWLKPEFKEFLIAVLSAATHPVLLAFGSSTNPLNTARKLALYVDIIASAGVFSWRCDFAGLAAVAHGGLGAAVGAAPGLRRCTPPKDKGKARRPDDATPYVLIPGHMHWMKTGAMREELYVASAAPSCGCKECGGQRIDRFTEAQAAAAARHNRAVVDEYAQAVLRAPENERAGVWRTAAQDAVVAHEATAAATGRTWPAPLDVATFAESAYEPESSDNTRRVKA